MAHHLPPPPPYSETDTFSNFGGSSSANYTPLASQADDDSLGPHQDHEYATSSIDESTIYTPPYTPDGSCHPDSAIPNELESFSSSATAYFTSRPVRQPLTDVLLVHTVLLDATPHAGDIPFPHPEGKWLCRDLTKQDWATFINHLMPYHIDVNNNSVADRKLKSELIDERMQRLTLQDQDNSRADPKEINALLATLRTPTGTHPAKHLDVSDVVSEWNEGFFGPRGLHVNASTVPEEALRSVPEAWKENNAEPVTSPGRNQGTASRRGSGWIRADGSGFHIGRNFLSADNNGFRMGGIVADNNGFRIGNILVADSNGFRLGPMVADSNGFRLGGNHTTLGIAPSPAPFQYGHREDTNRDGGQDLCGRRGGRRGRHHDSHRGRNRAHDLDHGRNHRSRSNSSSSSSSSCSSASELSVGSLPDLDKFKDAQLPIVKQSIQGWLDHPHQPITKKTVQELKQEMKGVDGRAITSSLSDSELRNLRGEVRGLLRTFKNIKRAQKQERRAAKRERRNQKRDAKRERRAAKRETKFARREAKKEEKRQAKGKGGEMNTIPPIPNFMPSVGRPFLHEAIHRPGMGRIPSLTSASAQLMSEAHRVQADANRKQGEAYELRAQAQTYFQDEKRRLRTVDQAEKLEEEADIMMRESERITAEAMQLHEDQSLIDKNGGGQESGVI